MKTSKGKVLKIIIGLFLLGILVSTIFGYRYYKMIYLPNIKTPDTKVNYLYIPRGATFEEVLDSLKSGNFLEDEETFKEVSKIKKYGKTIKSGRYEIRNNMSNNELINMLRIGNQKPLNVTFNNVRTKKDISGIFAKQLDIDSVSFLELLNDRNFIEQYGFNSENVMSMFLPDTYSLNWDTNEKELFARMLKEYNKFWNQDRISKADACGLSKIEVSVLASIVQAEQASKNDEKPIIAGLYINRLKMKMPLESDPTLIFASGDFTRKRVLNEDKEIDSPYNTYKNLGLPPGPINLPEKSSLNSVLDYRPNNFIFMCAKEDFSGYHNFSTNLAQHNINAERYRQALNKRKIYH